MEEKHILVEEHGTAYYIEEGLLACAPMCQDDTVDWEGSGLVEESPKSFKRTHLNTCQRLGLNWEQANKAISQVRYYDE